MRIGTHGALVADGSVRDFDNLHDQGDDHVEAPYADKSTCAARDDCDDGRDE